MSAELFWASFTQNRRWWRGLPPCGMWVQDRLAMLRFVTRSMKAISPVHACWSQVRQLVSRAGTARITISSPLNTTSREKVSPTVPGQRVLPSDETSNTARTSSKHAPQAAFCLKAPKLAHRSTRSKSSRRLLMKRTVAG